MEEILEYDPWGNTHVHTTEKHRNYVVVFKVVAFTTVGSNCAVCSWIFGVTMELRVTPHGCQRPVFFICCVALIPSVNGGMPHIGD